MKIQLNRREVGDIDRGSESRQVERETSRSGTNFEHVIARLHETLQELAMNLVRDAPAWRRFQACPFRFSEVVVERSRPLTIIRRHELTVINSVVALNHEPIRRPDIRTTMTSSCTRCTLGTM